MASALGLTIIKFLNQAKVTGLIRFFPLCNVFLTAEGPDLSEVTIPADAYEPNFEVNIKGFFGQDCWIETTNRVDITTSTSNIDAESEDISPNPIPGEVYISTVLHIGIPVSAKVYDNQGHFLWHKELNKSDNFEIDFSREAKELYFVELSIGKQRFVNKITRI